jgi:ketosteroid isomerase-like protein
VSARNVEIARRGYAAIARGDIDAVRDFLDPRVKWHGGDESAPGACHGSDEVVRFVQRALRRRPIGELVDVIDAGDRVVVVLRPPGGGSELRANATTFRDGKVVEMVAYESPEAALAAAGV